MSAAVLYGLVILSALAHPAWNAIVKSAGDRVMAMVAIRCVGLVLGLAVLPFVDWPAAPAWKWLALTAVVQFGYYALLIRSYDIGDMSVVYPLARGLAPVLTTLAAFVAIDEALSAAHLAAVLLISLGIMVLTTLAAFLAIDEALSAAHLAAVLLISLGIMVLSRGAGASRAAVGTALATGASVAAYSFCSGMGVRTGGTVLGFQAWLEIVNGVVMVGFALLTRPRAALDYARRHSATGLLAGVLSVLGFLAYLAAVQSLPLGPVTALRETGVIFGAVIGALVLKEGFGLRRIAAATMVVLGIALLTFWR